ncbi:GbsR/MarR family transcriptional regulator [Streptomyces sp. NBC_00091]|uniref:GbsR/MarR family transcriptional regulator n=1 Tax=Streptomyces sp. NBC_00091 TaxID=2975648 RepID=UPI00224D5F6E|nr:MarR family transcriptional regulator [Streptomyces sp. NBC_00091]MCX5381029.1 MarR family transcriptional regulator [Streptomyces sp. NBC_00091]
MDATASASESEQRGYSEEVSAFVERFAADLVAAGVPRMPSRVFACLLAEDAGALSAAELSERLKVSPAAVSGAVRYLAQVHMVGRERAPGERREIYRVHADLWYETVTSRDQMLNRWAATLKQGVEALGPDTPAGMRAEETADFFSFVKLELDSLMDRWRAHRGG